MPFPFRRISRRAQRHTGAAIAAIGFENHLLAVLPRIFEKIALLAMRQTRPAIACGARPKHMPAEQPALLGAEKLFRDRRVGQNLPTTFVIEIASERRHDPVLPEEK